jgi:hypothetical protein
MLHKVIAGFAGGIAFKLALIILNASTFLIMQPVI